MFGDFPIAHAAIITTRKFLRWDRLDQTYWSRRLKNPIRSEFPYWIRKEDGVWKAVNRANGSAPMTAILATLCLALTAVPISSNVHTQDWLVFRNPATGISFRYPPSLRVRERDPRQFGLPDAKLIVDLVGDTRLNPGTIVLRFIVRAGSVTPQTIALRSKLLRSACKSLDTLTLDGHQALVCVSCGRAACHWGVEVLQPRECTILTLLGGADSDEAQPPPHDGIFPLLSIIATLHIELPYERNHLPQH